MCECEWVFRMMDFASIKYFSTRSSFCITSEKIANFQFVTNHLHHFDDTNARKQKLAYELKSERERETTSECEDDMK